MQAGFIAVQADVGVAKALVAIVANAQRTHTGSRSVTGLTGRAVIVFPTVNAIPAVDAVFFIAQVFPTCAAGEAGLKIFHARTFHAFVTDRAFVARKFKGHAARRAITLVAPGDLAVITAEAFGAVLGDIKATVTLAVINAKILRV